MKRVGLYLDHEVDVPPNLNYLYTPDTWHNKKITEARWHSMAELQENLPWLDADFDDDWID